MGMLNNSNLADPVELIEEAFDNYMEKITISRSELIGFKSNFIKMYCGEGGRAQKKNTIRHLLETQFNWPEFEKWRDHFRKTGQWPQMWHGIEDYTPPSSPEEMIALLTIKSMRHYLEKKIAIKGIRSKKEYIQAMLSVYTDKEIQDIASEYIEEKIDWHSDKSDKIAELLCHTLSTHVYSLRQRRQHYRMLSRAGKNIKYAFWMMTTYCPVEDHFRTLRIQGKIKGYPPFFPGDRNDLNIIDLPFGANEGLDIFPIDINITEILPPKKEIQTRQTVSDVGLLGRIVKRLGFK